MSTEEQKTWLLLTLAAFVVRLRIEDLNPVMGPGFYGVRHDERAEGEERSEIAGRPNSDRLDWTDSACA